MAYSLFSILREVRSLKAPCRARNAYSGNNFSILINGNSLDRGDVTL